MPRKKGTQAERDAAYRKALGLAPDQKLPGVLGIQATAGGSRGGRGARQRGKGKKK